jgi:mono/diheme cytochrome c family protein
MRRSPAVVRAAALVSLVLWSPVAALAEELAMPKFGPADIETMPPGGQRDFLTYCAPCHGLDGSGNGPVSVALAGAPPSLLGLAAANGGAFPAERVTAVIVGASEVAAHGTREMPVWGRWFGYEADDPALTKPERQARVDERVAGIVAYLASIQTK